LRRIIYVLASNRDIAVRQEQDAVRA
jgi:hypothetical protein